MPGAPRLPRNLLLCPRVCLNDRYVTSAGFILTEKTSVISGYTSPLVAILGSGPSLLPEGRASYYRAPARWSDQAATDEDRGIGAAAQERYISGQT